MSVMSRYDINKEVKEAVDLAFKEHLKISDMEEMYRHAVFLSLKLGKEISERRSVMPDRQTPDPIPFPPCHFFEYDMNGVPMYQLSYEGILPIHDHDKKFKSSVRDYYTQAAMEVLVGKDIRRFRKAFVYICHFFSDFRVRDLDTRNRSFLINAIRFGGMVPDDDWKGLSIMEEGFLDIEKKNHIEVFVTSHENDLKMVEYVRKKYKEGAIFRV